MGRLQQTHHSRHNPTLLNEVDLLLKDGGRVAVETDDEAALHLQAGAADVPDILE